MPSACLGPVTTAPGEEPRAPVSLMKSQQPQQHLWKSTSQAHFERWAGHYDRDIINILLFRPSYRRILAHLRQGLRRGRGALRILDVGCGTGSLLVQCCQLEGVVASGVGLDLSPHMLSQAQAKAQHLGLAGKLGFTLGDAEHLPFADESFDLVTCCNSFHHYPHQDRAVAEMHRVLARHGEAIIIDGSRDDPLGYFIFEVCVARAEGHVHHCTAQRFGKLFTDAGFDAPRQHVFGVCPPALFNLALAGK